MREFTPSRRQNYAQLFSIGFRRAIGNTMHKATWETHIATKTETKNIDQKLGIFNQAMLSFSGDSERPIAYVIRKNGKMIAGISACLDWGFIVHIELLFVDEEYRNQGMGKF